MLPTSTRSGATSPTTGARTCWPPTTHRSTDQWVEPTAPSAATTAPPCHPDPVRCAQGRLRELASEVEGLGRRYSEPRSLGITRTACPERSRLDLCRSG